MEQMFALERWVAADADRPGRGHRLELALTALAGRRPPGQINRLLEHEGTQALESLWKGASESERSEITAEAEDLAKKGIDVLFRWSEAYPERLHAAAQAPPLLFYWGSIDALHSDAIGMCGARESSQAGLEAARKCGEEVARTGLTVVSGYARGVDTETHLGALNAGGRTIVVLAEGFNHFRRKRSFGGIEWDPDKMLVLSQFPPGQSWNVGAAMTRNTVIVGLALGLVVVEAAEKGGTLNAGLRAVEMKRPVLALDFAGGTPRGNQILFERGAVKVSTLNALRHELVRLKSRPGQPGQLHLM